MNFLTIILVNTIIFVTPVQSQSQSQSQSYDKKILNDQFSSLKGFSLNKRAHFWSRYFVGKSVVVDPLGEGSTGSIDKDPLFRFDAFDCQSYIETVLALTHASNFKDFERVLKKIRYKKGGMNFASRRHFFSSDSLPYFFEERLITTYNNKVSPREGLLKTKEVLIDRHTFFKKKGIDYKGRKVRANMKFVPIEEIFGRNSIWTAKEKEIISRKKKGKNLQEKIKFKVDLFLKGSKVNKRISSIKNKILFINFIRNTNIYKKKIGTNIIVSHHGILFLKNDQLILRHATLKWPRKIKDESFFSVYRLSILV